MSSLFKGRQVRLASVNLEKDAPVIARWTEDGRYFQDSPAMPVPVASHQAKKQLEEWTKEPMKQVLFAVRSGEADALVGLILFEHLDWTNGRAFLTPAFAPPLADWIEQAQEAIDLAAAYAFRELNLHSVAVSAPDCGGGLAALLQAAGFRVVVRQREAIYRFGQRWDQLIWVLQASAWAARYPVQEVVG